MRTLRSRSDGRAAGAEVQRGIVLHVGEPHELHADTALSTGAATSARSQPSAPGVIVTSVSRGT